MRFNELKKLYSSLTEADQKHIEEMIMTKLGLKSEITDTCGKLVADYHNHKKPDCPECHVEGSHKNINKNGKDKYGNQCYVCKVCGKKFTDRTGTMFHGSRKDAETWRKFIHMTLSMHSISECERECNICHQTAFVWRHKVLKVLLGALITERKMNGIIQMDETFMPTNYKGNHYKGFHVAGEYHDISESPLPRAPIRNSKDNKSRSQSDKVSILCMTQNGYENLFALAIGKGKITAEKLAVTVGGHADKDTCMFITDEDKTYINYFADNKYKHIALKSNTTGNKSIHRPEIRDGYHFQSVNNMHRNIKQKLFTYRGLSSKYLNHYLSLFIFLTEFRENKEAAKENEFLTMATNSTTRITRNELSEYSALPSVA